MPALHDADESIVAGEIPTRSKVRQVLVAARHTANASLQQRFATQTIDSDRGKEDRWATQRYSITETQLRVTIQGQHRLLPKVLRDIERGLNIGILPRSVFVIDMKPSISTVDEGSQRQGAERQNRKAANVYQE
jgi:hypothetical protein